MGWGRWRQRVSRVRMRHHRLDERFGENEARAFWKVVDDVPLRARLFRWT
jgi:hypothetical protein